MKRELMRNAGWAELQDNPHYRALSRLYEREGNGALLRDAQEYWKSGFLFCTSHYFIMGKPVNSVSDPWQIKSAKWFFRWNTVDAWFVAGFAGDMGLAVQALPFFLPKIGFCREFNDTLGLRFYNMERWLCRIQAMHGKTQRKGA